MLAEVKFGVAWKKYKSRESKVDCESNTNRATMNYYMVVGEHYNRLRNIYDIVDDFHIIVSTMAVGVILSQVVPPFFQLFS